MGAGGLVKEERGWSGQREEERKREEELVSFDSLLVVETKKRKDNKV